MKHYTWIEPGFDEESDDISGITVVWSEQEILDHSWNWWYKAMVDKYGEGHELITEQECINDFVICHWAVEVNRE